MNKERTVKIVLVAIVGIITALGAIPLYRHRHSTMPVIAGPGVTKVIKLSDYAPSLKGTMGDIDVFVMEGKEPGGKAFLMSDTHANEPAGLLALSAAAFLLARRRRRQT